MSEHGRKDMLEDRSGSEFSDIGVMEFEYGDIDVNTRSAGETGEVEYGVLEVLPRRKRVLLSRRSRGRR